MRVRVANQEESLSVFGEGTTAKHLVKLEDTMGAELFELVVPTTTDGPSIYNQSTDIQLYYVIYGQGKLVFADNQTVELAPDSFVAFAGDEKFHVSAASELRFAVVFYHGDHRIERNITTLKEVSNTHKDVNWGNGQSRRFVVKKDNYGFAFANTFGWANRDSSLEYRSHKEFCYYYAGNGEYNWNAGKESHKIETDGNNGTVFIMNEHDKHHMVIGEKPSICLSIWYPAIEGNEKHDFSSGFSTY